MAEKSRNLCVFLQSSSSLLTKAADDKSKVFFSHMMRMRTTQAWLGLKRCCGSPEILYYHETVKLPRDARLQRFGGTAVENGPLFSFMFWVSSLNSNTYYFGEWDTPLLQIGHFHAEWDIISESGTLLSKVGHNFGEWDTSLLRRTLLCCEQNTILLIETLLC